MAKSKSKKLEKVREFIVRTEPAAAGHLEPLETLFERMYGRGWHLKRCDTAERFKLLTLLQAFFPSVKTLNILYASTLQMRDAEKQTHEEYARGYIGHIDQWFHRILHTRVHRNAPEMLRLIYDDNPATQLELGGRLHGHIARTYPALTELHIDGDSAALRAEECLTDAVKHFVGCMLGGLPLADPALLLDIVSNYIVVGVTKEGIAVVIAH